MPSYHPFSLVGESEANGVVENAIQRVHGQIRKIELDIESNADAKLTPRYPVWPWLIQSVAQSRVNWVINGLPYQGSCSAAAVVALFFSFCNSLLFFENCKF